MGSSSDYDVMSAAIQVLEEFGVEYEKKVISAHRTPDLMCEYAKSAKERGIGAIIAGAGGAAHVAGVVAGMTTVPVIGVPIQTKALGGMDSLLSIVQMPGGIPVATMAINGAKATRATIPKASVTTLPPRAVQAPMANGSRNVDVMGPLATPPESKAMPTKIGGTNRVSNSARAYPGISTQ